MSSATSSAVSNENSSHVKEYLKKTATTKCTFIKNEPPSHMDDDMYSEVTSPIIDIEMVNADMAQSQNDTSSDNPNLKTESTNATSSSATTIVNKPVANIVAKFRTSANETAFTLQSLVQSSQINNCKFCESFLPEKHTSDNTESEFENKENV